MNCEVINYYLALKKTHIIYLLNLGILPIFLCGALYSKIIRCSLKMATAIDSYKAIFINMLTCKINTLTCNHSFIFKHKEI